MAWTSIPIFTDAVFTSSQANLLRGNLLETAPALATTPGQYFVATGTNTITTRRMARDQNLNTGTRTSTSFGQSLTLLAGGASPGPSTSADCGSTVQVGVHAYMVNSGTNDFSFMSFDMSGAHTLAAGDFRSAASIDYVRLSAVHWITGVTPGTIQFDAAYRVEAGTGTWDDRVIWVISL
jgi:hypothetical protein